MTTFIPNSSKGGGGFNEFRFEDKKGEEQIFINAQKNMDIRVGNDRFESIGNNRHLTVEKIKYDLVKDDSHIHVQGDLYDQCDKDHHETISGQEARDISGAMSVNVDGNVAEVFVGESHSENHVRSILPPKPPTSSSSASSSVTIKVGGTSIAMTSSGISINTSGDYDTTSGGSGTKFTAGSTLDVEAGAQLGMTSGAAFSIDSAATLSVTASAGRLDLRGCRHEGDGQRPDGSFKRAVIKIN